MLRIITSAYKKISETLRLEKKSIILERSINLYGDPGKELDIFFNPTRSELQECTSSREARSLMFDNGDLVCWDALKAVHYRVYNYILEQQKIGRLKHIGNISDTTQGYIERKGNRFIIDIRGMDYLGEKVAKAIMSKHPHIQVLYSKEYINEKYI